jgi:hypothetical protein
MSKTFTFAGTCVVEGATVYKFANDANRAAVLAKLGATNINIVELPNAMDKEAAVAFLATQGIVAEKAVKTAAPKAVKVKAAKPVKTKLAKVATSNPRGTEAAAANAEYFIKAWFNDRVTPEQAEQVKANW